MRIDAHQHFWQYNPAEHVWMTDDLAALRTTFLPDDLKPLLDATGFEGSIVVQARQNLAETEWLLSLANEYPHVCGVVGWVDLRSDEVEQQLAHYAQDPRLCGVRHVIHDEHDDAFMLGEAFQRGIGLLNQYGLTYDLLLFPRHLPYACTLVERFPEQPFVLDHIAKPPIDRGEFSPWREQLKRLAEHPNVYCKVSGMVTEAKWKNWRYEEFVPYLDLVFEAFGPERLMIGSDWPVCTVSGSYEQTMGIVMDYLAQFDSATREAVLGDNAARFYGVS
jgi:L-fuconolactonase